MMAGRLTGSVDGRPVVGEADASGLVVSVARFQAAWTLRRSVRSLLPGLEILKRSGVPVRLSVAGMVSLEVLPRPSAFVRLLAADLAKLV